MSSVTDKLDSLGEHVFDGLAVLQSKLDTVVSLIEEMMGGAVSKDSFCRRNRRLRLNRRYESPQYAFLNTCFPQNCWRYARALNPYPGHSGSQGHVSAVKATGRLGARLGGLLNIRPTALMPDPLYAALQVVSTSETLGVSPVT